MTAITCGPIEQATTPCCFHCGHPLWASASVARGYCEGCHVAGVEPRCTKTEEECFNTWQSWRDDCHEHGNFRCDVDQCRRGHPDDGVTWCGACGHGLNWPGTPGPEPCTGCGMPTWLDPGAEVATCNNPTCSTAEQH